MFDMTQISGIAERIKGGLGADTRVFLFGSYAWGEPNEDSDLDFAVVSFPLMFWPTALPFFQPPFRVLWLLISVRRGVNFEQFPRLKNSHF